MLWRNAKCYEEKSYYYQIYHCLKVKPSFYEKLFQKEKNKLLWIYARWLSSHLWSNGRQKLSFASLNWNPWEPQSNLGQKVNPSILKGDFSSRIDPSLFISIEPLLLDFKWNQLSFPSIEINKPLLIPVHSISQVRFKFRSQLKPSSLWGWWCGKMPWEKKSWFLSKCFPEHGSGIPTALGMEFLVALVNYKAVD